jgi:hypothetical protein
MSKKAKHHNCAVCGRLLPARDLVPGAAVRNAIAAEVLREHPDWSQEKFICRSDLNRYRTQHVHSLLESEKGELTSLEQEVLRSLREHELLARNVDAEFEQHWTLGERLADRIATFGGSWPFLICFAAFLALWIGLNTFVLIARPLDPYPLHPAESHALVSGGDPGAHHHDEPESPGGERSPALAA